MRSRNYCSWILLIGIICSCNSPSESTDTTKPQEVKSENLSGTLKINGAYSLYPLVKQWADNFMTIHPEVTILVDKNGTTSGLSNVLNQTHGLAMISRELTADEETNNLWKVPVAKDGVVPIINRQNPFIDQIRLHGIKADQLIQLFTRDKAVYWGELLEMEKGESVKVYTREEGSGTAETWAHFLWVKPEDLYGEQISGDEEMIKKIQQNPHAIGYGNLIYVFNSETGSLTDNVEILPIDFNQNGRIDPKECPCDSLAKIQRAIWIGKYPRHLCRTLNLASFGKPTDNLTVEFIKWILTEGQEKVKEMGYCNLNNSQIECALKSLE